MSDAFDAYLFPLSEGRAKNEKARIMLHTMKSGDCLLWNGEQKNGYGIFRIVIDGKRRKVRVHRYLFFLCNDCKPLEKSVHVSHRCHNKLCSQIHHLSYEEAAVNAQRQTCFHAQQCFSHWGFENCIL